MSLGEHKHEIPAQIASNMFGGSKAIHLFNIRGQLSSAHFCAVISKVSIASK